MPKGKITFDEYKEIGEKLKICNEYMAKIYVKLANTYSKKFATHLQIALNRLNKQRNLIDNQLFLDYPNEENSKLFDVVYGKSSEFEWDI
jgi:hypothetical protein